MSDQFITPAPDTTTRPATGQYMPQLDALRFVAVLGVMVAHNWHPRGLPWLLSDLAIEWAGHGVRLFFVLSGFLITGILLDCRDLVNRQTHGRLYFVRQFYVRRFLRIFPIYYLVVAVALLIDLPPAREVWVWLLTYTSNIYITTADQWIGRLGHFWTLAVEEQFYLVWPWVVLFARRNWLVPIVLTLMTLAPIYRWYAYAAFPFNVGAMDFKAATFTLASLDTLGAGALLALLWRSEIRYEVLERWLSRLVLPLGLVGYGVLLLAYHYRVLPRAFFTFADTTSSMIFVWLVSAAAVGFGGSLRTVLELKPLLYLGRISYGIYVYHNLVPLVVIAAFGYLGTPFRVPGPTNFVVSGIVTVILAALSWELFEQPINNLKKHFVYASKSALPPTESTPVPVGLQRSL